MLLEFFVGFILVALLLLGLRSTVKAKTKLDFVSPYNELKHVGFKSSDPKPK